MYLHHWPKPSWEQELGIEVLFEFQTFRTALGKEQVFSKCFMSEWVGDAYHSSTKLNEHHKNFPWSNESILAKVMALF